MPHISADSVADYVMLDNIKIRVLCKLVLHYVMLGDPEIGVLSKLLMHEAYEPCKQPGEQDN